jgi:hypothetical protein
MLRFVIPLLMSTCLSAAVIVDEDFSGFQYSWSASPTVQTAAFNGSDLKVTASGSQWATADLSVNLGSDFVATWDTKVVSNDYSFINLYANGISYSPWGGVNDGYSMWVDINDGVLPRLEVQSFQNATYRSGVGDGDVALNQEIALNEWMSWEISKLGSVFQVSVNDQLLHNFNDQLYAASDFYLGLGSAGGITAFDNLTITTVDAAVPEPTSLSLLLLSFGAMVLNRKRRKSFL